MSPVAHFAKLSAKRSSEAVQAPERPPSQPQPVGTWVLVALGFAKEVVPQDELVLIEEALAALAASLEGGYDAREYFADLDRARFTTPAPVAGGGR